MTDGSAVFDDVTYRTSELAAGSGAPLAASGDSLVAAAGVMIDEAVLAAAASEARAMWASWLGAGAVAALDAVSLQTTDLPGAMLGSTVDSTVWIDRDAAGHGWFLLGAAADPLPLLEDGGLITEPRIGPDGAIDLLSVVAHEFSGAAVARTARLGHDVAVGDRVRIDARARVGDGTVIGAGAIVPDDALVLAGTRISAAHEMLQDGRFGRSDLRPFLARLFDFGARADEDEGHGRSSRGGFSARLH